MTNGRKGRTFSRCISHCGNFLQTENSGTMFICKNIELLPFLRNYSKNHLFDQPRKEKGTYKLSYE